MTGMLRGEGPAEWAVLPAARASVTAARRARAAGLDSSAPSASLGESAGRGRRRVPSSTSPRSVIFPDSLPGERIARLHLATTSTRIRGSASCTDACRSILARTLDAEAGESASQ